MRRLEEKGRGILLLHDIHPATALAVPVLLKELKERGYHVVQVVAAGERPASVPESLGAPEYNKEGWPRVLKANVSRETPTKVALRHRAKTMPPPNAAGPPWWDSTSSNGTDSWKQKQSNWFGQPRGLASSSSSLS